MYAIRSYYAVRKPLFFVISEIFKKRNQGREYIPRITSYNVCYTKLLREKNCHWPDSGIAAGNGGPRRPAGHVQKEQGGRQNHEQARLLADQVVGSGGVNRPVQEPAQGNQRSRNNFV